MDEYQFVMKNDVSEIVSRPKGKSMVTSKCIYMIQHAKVGSIRNCKARFMERGFSRIEGVDYEETFSLVTRYISISEYHFSCFGDGMKITSYGYKGNIPQWCD